jgi:hypothetical protein
VYGVYLKRYLPLYLTVGIMTAVLLAANIVVFGQHRRLASLFDRMDALHNGEQRLVIDNRLFASRVGEIGRGVPKHIQGLTAREQLLAGIDDLQRSMAGESVTLGELAESGDEASIPCDIVLTWRGYSPLLTKLMVLQRLSFPYYRLQSLTMERTGETILCSTKGVLVARKVSGGGP